MIRSAKRNTIAIAIGANLLSLMILAAVPPSAQADFPGEFPGFGPSYHYDNGYNPSVAANSGTVVEVHNGTSGAGPLWYRVGKVNGSTITWNDSHPYDNNGYNPSVAMNSFVGRDTTVVEVHNGTSGAGPLWYRVGKVNGSTITWNDSHQYDNGFNPSVALAGNIVVEVHNGTFGVGPLWYRMGKLNGGTITWSDSHKFDSYSTNPSVSAAVTYTTNDNAIAVLDVVEVHNSNAYAGPLWFRDGELTDADDFSTISWGDPYNYDAGWNPKIAWDGCEFDRNTQWTSGSRADVV